MLDGEDLASLDRMLALDDGTQPTLDPEPSQAARPHEIEGPFLDKSKVEQAVENNPKKVVDVGGARQEMVYVEIPDSPEQAVKQELPAEEETPGLHTPDPKRDAASQVSLGSGDTAAKKIPLSDGSLDSGKAAKELAEDSSPGSSSMGPASAKKMLVFEDLPESAKRIKKMADLSKQLAMLKQKQATRRGVGFI